MQLLQPLPQLPKETRSGFVSGSYHDFVEASKAVYVISQWNRPRAFGQTYLGEDFAGRYDTPPLRSKSMPTSRVHVKPMLSKQPDVAINENLQQSETSATLVEKYCSKVNSKPFQIAAAAAAIIFSLCGIYHFATPVIKGNLVQVKETKVTKDQK